MTLSDLYIILALLLLSLPVLGLRLKYFNLHKVPLGTRLPPGPKGIPLVGNARDIATPRQFEVFSQWAKEYGDVVYVNAFMRHMIILNTAEVAYELFNRRSALYSDRGDSTMINDLMGGDWVFVFMRYGERWRMLRRAFYEKFQLTTITAYQSIQTQHTHALMKKLLTSPQDFNDHIRHHSGAIIMQLVYGIAVVSKNDPYIEMAEEALSGLVEAAGSGAFLVDVLPILKYVPAWFPGASFQRKARVWRAAITRMRLEPFAVTKSEFETGAVKTSFVASMLEKFADKRDATLIDEEVIRDAAGVAYGAGAETTSSSLSWFILAMVLYPGVQRKAHAELDAVVQDRLPAFQDRDKLPYINAVCKEIYRWRPVSPLGVPHRVTQDDIYRDYFIPAGTIVIGNAWTILHDERVYGSNAEEFDPDRFLKHGINFPDAAFGHGRRKCPGRYLADNTVFLTVACILKLFNITHEVDRRGNVIPVDSEPRPGFLSRPTEFACKITPRSELAMKTLSNF